MEKHELISAYRELVKENGGPVSRDACNVKIKSYRYSLSKHFGGYHEKLKEAAGEITQKQEGKLLRQYKAICSKTEQIQGFFRHTLDLEELFNRAGNPEVVKLVSLYDVHAKFVDVPAFSAALKFIAYYNPDITLLGGDFVDCEGLSHWPSESLEPRRIVPEMKQARELLQKIQDASKNASTRIYLTGNHEAWITQAMSQMPELFEGLADLGIEINLKTLLALEKFGYDLFELNHLVQIGKAHFTHGLFTGTYHAKKHIDVLKDNIYYGHTHDDQTHNQTSMNGPMEAACGGCLCRLDAKFLKGKPNNWTHSLQCHEFFRDGTYTYYKVKIINGRIAFNGSVFDGNAKE